MDLPGAVSMLPGMVVAVKRFVQLRRSGGRLMSLAPMTFLPLCACSIMYHAWPWNGKVKKLLLRADYTSQQICAMAMALGTYRGRAERAAAVSTIALLSAASTRVHPHAGSGIMIAIQTAVAMTALGLRGMVMSEWWFLGFLCRIGSQSTAGSISKAWHAMFHLCLVRAFDRHWASWLK